MTYQRYDNSVVNSNRYRAGGLWHNPGRDEAVAALVLAFFFPILGFILGLLSLGRSRRAGWPGERLAKAALWVSVLMVVLGIASLWFLRVHIGTGGYFPVIRNWWWV